MTNLDKLKQQICAMTAEEMAKRINKYLYEDACNYCAYDNDKCSSEDCEYGIKVFLERQVSQNA